VSRKRRRKPNDALVLDSDRQFVEYVTSAMARRLLKERKARVVSKEPFTLMLPLKQREVPRPEWSATKGKRKMSDRHNPQPSKLYAQRGGVANILQHFSEIKEIWVQNQTDMQISLDIDTGNGTSEGFLIPPARDPVCLTERYGFDALASSANLRRMLSKRIKGRPLMILMEEEEVEKYYEAKALQMGARNPDGSADIGAALEKASKTFRELTTMATADDTDDMNAPFTPPKSAMELMNMELANRGLSNEGGRLVSARQQAGAQGTGSDGLYMEDIVKPKILNLCQGASLQVPDGQRLTEEQLWSALEPMMPSMTVEDFQHVESHGTYRRIKTWARQQISRLLANEPAVDMAMVGHQQVGQADSAQLGVLAPQGLGPQGPSTAEYQGPTGFVNASIPGAAPNVNDAQVLGPDGRPA